MAIRFVSTEILTSKDGVSFTESEKVDSKEVSEARRENRPGKSLYDQLEAQKEKQQEAYDEHTKAIYAPPRGLEDDDVNFFRDQELRHRQAQRAEEKLEVDAFSAARAEFHQEKKVTVSQAAKNHNRDDDVPPVKLRRKVKAPVSSSHEEEKKGHDRTTGLTSLLGVYNDDDNDNDD